LVFFCISLYIKSNAGRLNLTDEENAKICCADGSNLYAASINNAMVGVYCDKLTPIY